jgi:hypothetical protein
MVDNAGSYRARQPMATSSHTPAAPANGGSVQLYGHMALAAAQRHLKGVDKTAVVS